MDTYLKLFFGNRKHIEALSIADEKCLDRLSRYLKTVPVSAADLELMRRDIIGMAEDAAGRGETLSDIIGTNEERFCIELAENCPRQSVAERLLYCFWLISASLLVVCIALWMVHGFSSTITLNANYLLYMVLWITYVVLCGNLFARKAIFSKGSKKIIFTLVYVAACIPLVLLSYVIMDALLPGENGMPFMLAFSSWHLAAILGALALFSTCAWMYFLNRKLRADA